MAGWRCAGDLQEHLKWVRPGLAWPVAGSAEVCRARLQLGGSRGGSPLRGWRAASAAGLEVVAEQSAAAGVRQRSKMESASAAEPVG